MEKVYIVTLKNRDDLEDFYVEMSSKGFKLHMKRKISRNTNYYMTQEQADELKKDSRVIDVELADNIIAKPNAIYNNTPYTKNGFFWKSGSFPIATDFQWGHIHAGSASQIGKGSFGHGATQRKNASVDVFNNGKHVDVIIVDEPMAYDSEEWYSPSTNTSRFVQYQWFNELNSFVTSIDDDGINTSFYPTGNVTYHQNSALSDSHGQHVGGTVAGQYYGWANEANIYSMAFLDPEFHSGQSVPGFLVYDYLRAFHLHKAVNPVTGRKNPTITNHSYGGIYYLNPEKEVLSFSKLISVFYRGVTYNSGNPGPSGWSQSGVETDFGLRFDITSYPSYSAALGADIQDAIDDGVTFITAAGNDDLLVADPSSSDWNNTFTFEYSSGDNRTNFYNRGSWPSAPDTDAIVVGALSNEIDFKRAAFSMFGTGLDIYAPGVRIISCYGNTGTNDTKYSAGSANYYAIASGTSMASPQVAGVVATLATAKPRFTNSDVKGYIQRHSKDDDMPSGTIPNKYLISKNPRPTSGMIEDVKGERKTSGMTFPRRATLNYVA
jgi:subtilisin family serine protease